MSTKIYITESQANRLFLLTESSFYDFLEDYDCHYVLNQYLRNPKGTQQWRPLINPASYQKALQEFMQYGKLVRFPEREVYKWMGIIMRNTAILEANTAICGHDTWYPIDDVREFIERWFGAGNVLEFDEDGDEVVIKVTPEQVKKLCRKRHLTEAVDSKGQQYFDFISQKEATRIGNQKSQEQKLEEIQKVLPLIQHFNKYYERSGEMLFVDQETGTITYSGDKYDILDMTGIFDWMVFPDGSDAISDYGIEPIAKVLKEYNDDLPAEKVLVLVNRALDVYHQRGDLSSIFIEGGSRTLSQISGT